MTRPFACQLSGKLRRFVDGLQDSRTAFRICDALSRHRDKKLSRAAIITALQHDPVRRVFRRACQGSTSAGDVSGPSSLALQRSIGPRLPRSSRLRRFADLDDEAVFVTAHKPHGPFGADQLELTHIPQFLSVRQRPNGSTVYRHCPRNAEISPAMIMLPRFVAAGARLSRQALRNPGMGAAGVSVVSASRP
jgi:hypothetical protein